MSQRLRSLPVVLATFCALTSGCDSSNRNPGGGGTRPAADANITDGTVGSDGSVASDSSVQDSATTDAGTIDTGVDPTTDASSPDSTVSSDAGVPDSGVVVDAGFTPSCIKQCNNTGDCPPSNPTLVDDTDNWTCNQNRCGYLGCLNPAECQGAFGQDYTCAQFPGFTFSYCAKACSTAVDCATNSPILGQDNYQCNNGACFWTGCNSTTECRDAYMSSDWACVPLIGLPISQCVRTCVTSQDCDQGGELYGADNYDCVQSGCVWKGCNTTTECNDTYMSTAYVCE